MEMLTGNGYPSKHLKGEVGQHYKDLETCDIFECVSANKHSRINLHQTGGYIWKKVARGEHVEVCGGGGSGGAFVVNLTEADDGTTIADKTFAEIAEAIENMKYVCVALIAGTGWVEVAQLTGYWPSRHVAFSKVEVDGNTVAQIYITITAENAVRVDILEKE